MTTADQLLTEAASNCADAQNAYNNTLGALNATLQPHIQNFPTAFFPDIAVAAMTARDSTVRIRANI